MLVVVVAVLEVVVLELVVVLVLVVGGTQFPLASQMPPSQAVPDIANWHAVVQQEASVPVAVPASHCSLV